jgi:hypothetical protein
MSMLGVALDPATVIVAVDPGKVMNRVWVSNGTGFVAEPVSMPVSRDGIGRLERLLVEHGAVETAIAVDVAAGADPKVDPGNFVVSNRKFKGTTTSCLPLWSPGQDVGQAAAVICTRTYK